MKAPRGHCATCERRIAITDDGTIWRHDAPPGMRISPLVSCAGTHLAPGDPPEEHAGLVPLFVLPQTADDAAT